MNNSPHEKQSSHRGLAKTVFETLSKTPLPVTRVAMPPVEALVAESRRDIEVPIIAFALALGIITGGIAWAASERIAGVGLGVGIDVAIIATLLGLKANEALERKRFSKLFTEALKKSSQEANNESRRLQTAIVANKLGLPDKVVAHIAESYQAPKIIRVSATR